MDNGQAGVAIGLIITLVVIVGGIVAFVVLQQNNQSSGTTSPIATPSTTPSTTPPITPPITPPVTPPAGGGTGDGTGAGTDGTTGGWCPAGTPTYIYTAVASGSATMQGMADYKGQQLCKTALSYNGQTYYYYGNEDGSVWFLTDAIGTEQASEDFPMGYAAGNTLMPALTLNHGDFVDFVDEKLVPSTVSDSWDYSGTVPCDLEETPFSEGQGMASGAGLRTCNTGYQIADMGAILIQDVFRSDLPSATYKGNPKAIVGHVYAVQLRDGNYAVLKITAVGADQESVTFQWEKL